MFVEVCSFRLVGPSPYSLRERRSLSLSAATHPLACLDRFVSPFPLHHGQGGFPWDGGLLFQGEGRGVDHALKLSSGRKPPPFAADPAIAW